MSSAIRELTALIQGVDAKTGDDDKSDVTTLSNIYDDGSLNPSMQKPDTAYVAGGARQDYWEEFQRMVCVKELFAEMKEEGRHITDVFEVTDKKQIDEICDFRSFICGFSNFGKLNCSVRYAKCWASCDP